MEATAKNYFLLADQYIVSASCLLSAINSSGNKSYGIGETQDEATDKRKANSAKSDSYLLVPSLFCCYQATELFIKGLLLLKGNKIEHTHGPDKLIRCISDLYGKESSVYISILDFYNQQFQILKEFKKTNNITSTKELYESFRYPETKAGIIFQYYNLHANGENGILEYRKLLGQIAAVKNAVLEEYSKSSLL